jgi:two-component system response regulator FixJ
MRKAATVESNAHIAVVDDVAAVRNSLKALLEVYGYVVHIYDSADAFIASLSEGLPSCVLLDVRMPGMSGLEAQRILAKRAPWLPAIIITGHGDIDMAVGAMKEGAFDFIEKPIDDARLLDTIAAAVDRARQAQGDSKDHDGLLNKYERLTNRERDILRLIANGLSTIAIASTLSISVRTVDHHRAKIHAKLEATSLSQLIRLALAIEHLPKSRKS